MVVRAEETVGERVMNAEGSPEEAGATSRRPLLLTTAYCDHQQGSTTHLTSGARHVDFPV